MDDEKKQYKVLRAIALGERREAGEIVHLTDDEAGAWGPDYVELYVIEEEVETPAAPADGDEAASGDTTTAPADPVAPVETGADTTTAPADGDAAPAADDTTTSPEGAETTTPAAPADGDEATPAAGE